MTSATSTNSLLEAAYQRQRDLVDELAFVTRYVLLLAEAIRLERALWVEMVRVATEIEQVMGYDVLRYCALINHHRYLVELHAKAYRRIDRRWYALNRGGK